MRRIELGVNIDHVATLRQARGTRYPDPVFAAGQAELAGADGITLHLREDRRHIQDEDLERLKAVCQTRINLEMAVTEEMLAIAQRIRPEHVCLVPEKREEVTTEGGLDVKANFNAVSLACQSLSALGIEVSLFVDPDSEQILASKDTGAHAVELHTGTYADNHQAQAYDHIETAAYKAFELGLKVNAGHGLHYHNVQPIAAIPVLTELNIGHAIVARAVLTGFQEAVRTMKALMCEARLGS